MDPSSRRESSQYSVPAHKLIAEKSNEECSDGKGSKEHSNSRGARPNHSREVASSEEHHLSRAIEQIGNDYLTGQIHMDSPGAKEIGSEGRFEFAPAKGLKQNDEEKLVKAMTDQLNRIKDEEWKKKFELDSPVSNRKVQYKHKKEQEEDEEP